MRRLDWALAALIMAFLLAAVAAQAAGGLVTHIGGLRLGGIAPAEVSLRRLVSHLPAPILPVDER